MSAATNTKRRDGTTERLSAVERDVAHLDGQITSLTRRVDQGFEDLQRAISNSKQPVTAFAGWASVILALVGAVIWPLIKADQRHYEQQQGMLHRELENAEARGEASQRFDTLEEMVRSALENRRDLDAKQTQVSVALSDKLDAVERTTNEKIDNLSHTLDNGLGRRIDEMTDPLAERLIAIEREVFKDVNNHRDIDRE